MLLAARAPPTDTPSVTMARARKRAALPAVLDVMARSPKKGTDHLLGRDHIPRLQVHKRKNGARLNFRAGVPPRKFNLAPFFQKETGPEGPVLLEDATALSNGGGASSGGDGCGRSSTGRCR